MYFNLFISQEIHLMGSISILIKILESNSIDQSELNIVKIMFLGRLVSVIYVYLCIFLVEI